MWERGNERLREGWRERKKRESEETAGAKMPFLPTTTPLKCLSGILLSSLLR